MNVFAIDRYEFIAFCSLSSILVLATNLPQFEDTSIIWRAKKENPIHNRV